eukprot:scaffold235153_cov21-Tisochrysis_lutea.AAC.2
MQVGFHVLFVQFLQYPRSTSCKLPGSSQTLLVQSCCSKHLLNAGGMNQFQNLGKLFTSSVELSAKFFCQTGRLINPECCIPGWHALLNMQGWPTPFNDAYYMACIDPLSMLGLLVIKSGLISLERMGHSVR